MENEIKIQEVLLKKIQFHFQNAISRFDLQFGNFNIDWYAKQVSDTFVYKLKMNIFGEQHNEKIYCPKNWFQHFKKEWFPDWLLKKFPVQNIELGTVELYQLYPHIKATIPEERHYIHYRKFEMMK